MSWGAESTLGAPKMSENGRRSCSMHDSVFVAEPSSSRAPIKLIELSNLVHVINIISKQTDNVYMSRVQLFRIKIKLVELKKYI